MKIIGFRHVVRDGGYGYCSWDEEDKIELTGKWMLRTIEQGGQKEQDLFIEGVRRWLVVFKIPHWYHEDNIRTIETYIKPFQTDKE